MARPRVFDVESAVATATALFWRQGYERTSLAELTGAMGITPPSFYFAFGSKEGLFRMVLEHYRATRLAPIEAALEGATARVVAEQMLVRLAESYTDPACPAGCLSVNCALPSGSPDDRVQAELAVLRRARRERLRLRLERARDEGDLPADADPAQLARYLISVGWGMAIDALAGASRAELLGTAEQALRAWPAERADRLGRD